MTRPTSTDAVVVVVGPHTIACFRSNDAVRSRVRGRCRRLDKCW